MRNKIMSFALYIAVFFAIPSSLSAQKQDQSNKYEDTLTKILKISGSTASTDSILPQVLSMIKQISPTTDEASLKEFATKWKEKIEKKVIEAYTPIYQKHMTLNELKQVVAFYESPVGRKLCETVSDCMGKTFPLMQQLGSEMMMEMPRRQREVGNTTAVEITSPKKTIANKNDDLLFSKAYTAPKDSIELSPIQYYYGIGTKPMLYSIEQRKNDTKVTFSAPVYFDWQWFHFGKGIKIFDKQSGDEYNVRGYDGGTPSGKLMIVQGFNNKCIFISLLFPKLKKNVKVIDILELPHEDDTLPSNDDGIARSYLNVKVQDYLISPKKSKKVYH